MLQRIAIILTGVLCLVVSLGTRAQGADSTMRKLSHIPGRFLDRVQAKTARLDQQLTRQTQKYIAQMTRQEARLQQQLMKNASRTDSTAIRQMFAGSAQRYAAYSQRMQQDTGSRTMLVSGPYQAYADSLRGTLAFLHQYPELSAAKQAKVQKAVSQLQVLQARMQNAAQVQQYMQQRQSQFRQYLSKYARLPSDVSNTFNGYKTQAAYYQQQVTVYRNMLNDPGQLFQAALTQLNKLPAFTSFMQRHSALSTLIPGGVGGPVTMTDPAKSGQGLPGRTQVLAGLQSQLGKEGVTAESVAQKGTSAAMQQSSGSGGGGTLGQLGAVGTLLSGGPVSGSIGNGGTAGASGAGAGGATGQLNPEKTQTFRHRFEFGVNLQNTPSSFYFPATTDVGISLGYKLNAKNRIGIGASYKIGWAGDIHHIQVSSQGASIRSFIDINISKTWFASGGLEYNYQPVVYTLPKLRDWANWEPAGLIGVSKVLSAKSKIIKNTKLQFLWNFLSNYEVPNTQPFIFRVGYSF